MLIVNQEQLKVSLEAAPVDAAGSNVCGASKSLESVM